MQWRHWPPAVLTYVSCVPVWFVQIRWFIRNEGSERRRAHIECVMKVRFKAYKFYTRGACVQRNSFNLCRMGTLSPRPLLGLSMEPRSLRSRPHGFGPLANFNFKPLFHQYSHVVRSEHCNRSQTFSLGVLPFPPFPFLPLPTFPSLP